MHTLEHAWLDAGTLDGIDAAQYGVRRVGVARRDGVVLEGDGAPFHDEPLAPASAAAVSDWIERTRPQRASLDVGALVLEPSVRFGLDAGGFDPARSSAASQDRARRMRSARSLERLLLETSRIVVLDPNSDFVRLGQPAQDVAPDVADRYRAAATGLAIRRSGDDSERLHVRFVDCDAAEQAAVLGSTRFATVTSTALWWNSWRPGHRRAGMGRRRDGAAARVARSAAPGARRANPQPGNPPLGSGRSARSDRCRTSSPPTARAA